MSIIGILLTHSEARKTGKPPFFFSRFKFERMKQIGNTHYCFDCAGDCGFKIDSDGNVTNSKDGDEWDSMKDHDPKTHTAVIKNAEKYPDVWSWLIKELPDDFPYTVHVPSV